MSDLDRKHINFDTLQRVNNHKMVCISLKVHVFKFNTYRAKHARYKIIILRFGITTRGKVEISRYWLLIMRKAAFYHILNVVFTFKIFNEKEVYIT